MSSNYRKIGIIEVRISESLLYRATTVFTRPDYMRNLLFSNLRRVGRKLNIVIVCNNVISILLS